MGINEVYPQDYSPAGEATALVDEAIGEFEELLDWLDLDKKERRRRYRWSPAEDRELKEWYGKLPRPELAARINAILQRQTGDPEAERSIEALNIHAQNMGLEAYSGNDREISVSDAARWVEVSYHSLIYEVSSGRIPSTRKGKLRYVTVRNLAIWYAGYRDRCDAVAGVLPGFPIQL